MSHQENGKMFIGGLGWDCTEGSLVKYFGTYGRIIDSVVMKNPNGRSRGFGFITFLDPTHVEDVLKSGPHLLSGKLIDPKACNPRTQTEVRESGDQCSRWHKIFIGGLPSSIIESELRSFFSKYGTVKDAVIMFDHEKKKSRNFGFVAFEDEDSVEEAVKDHFVEIKGKQVEIKRAAPRAEPESPPDGFFNPYGPNQPMGYMPPYNMGPMMKHPNRPSSGPSTSMSYNGMNCYPPGQQMPYGGWAPPYVPFMGGQQMKNGSAKSDASSFKNLPMDIEDKATEILINALSKCTFFSSSLLNLFMKFELNYEDVMQVAKKNPTVFKVINEQIYLKPTIKICKNHQGDGCPDLNLCNDLHICYKYVCTSCPDECCFLGHKIGTTHNQKTLALYGLHILDDDCLHRLLRFLMLHSDGSENIKICDSYNDETCSTESCSELHICKKFLVTNKRCVGECNLNHNPLELDCLSILNFWGYSINESPRDILIQIQASPYVKKQLEVVKSSLSDHSGDSDQQDSAKRQKSDGVTSETTGWSRPFYDDLN